MRVLKTSIFLSVISILIVKAFSQEDEETQDLILKNSESNTEKNIVGTGTSEPITINQPVKLPEIVVVNPIRRIGTANSQANISPCGGVDKNKADTLTNMGSLINAIWEIRTPVANGNCTVSMSTGLDVNFTALKPISDLITYDTDFSFSCGRQAGFEFQQFELPKDYACDQCTLQVKWETPVGEYYTCSDIMILGNKSK